VEDDDGAENAVEEMEVTDPWNFVGFNRKLK
jgi:hypothetical protein